MENGLILMDVQTGRVTETAAERRTETACTVVALHVATKPKTNT